LKDTYLATSHYEGVLPLMVFLHQQSSICVCTCMFVHICMHV